MYPFTSVLNREESCSCQFLFLQSVLYFVEPFPSLLNLQELVADVVSFIFPNNLGKDKTEDVHVSSSIYRREKTGKCFVNSL